MWTRRRAGARVALASAAAASPDASRLIADIDIFWHDAGDDPRAAPHEMENCPLDDRLQDDSQP